MLAPGTFGLVKRGPSRDYRIVQGATNAWVLAFDTAFGTSWAGFAARGQIRKNVADKTGDNILANITCTIVAAGPVDRVIEFVLSDDQSALVREVSGTWDCEIYNGTVVHRVVMGPWELNRETTRGVSA